jgi:hypothetical protein
MQQNQIKMNTLLAKVDHSQAVFNKEITAYAVLFKNKQGMFRGERKTYAPREGYPEDPTKQGTTSVQSTVNEQLDWFADKVAVNYLNEQFAVEATNSLGAKKVPLIVDGINFGELTALDLMRLKSILTSTSLDQMYETLPVRSDSEVWTKADGDYANREVFCTPMLKGVTRTTESEEVILKDPNLDPAHLPANYNAKTTVKKKTVEIGDYTMQKFSGEWTQTQKAQLLDRKSRLLNAVIAALKEVNDVEAAQSNLDVKALLNFIHKG